MRINHSLTIKHMAMVSALALVFIFIFMVILLFHFMRQYNYNTATQMESIARTVRVPLAVAILKADFPAAKSILQQINPSGVIGHADVVLPNQFQALRINFSEPRTISITIARLFDIPQQISLPLYAIQHPANPQPLAYLVLQADNWRAYRYVISLLSTLITSWLLLSLMLSVAISWCINRLIVHPLRHIATQLNYNYLDNIQHHQGDHRTMTPPCSLTLLRWHHDDEIGIIIRTYNQQQQRLCRYYQQQLALAALPKTLWVNNNKSPLSEDSPANPSSVLKPDPQQADVSLCPARLYETALNPSVSGNPSINPSAARHNPPLLVIHCATLNDPGLNEGQKYMLLLALAEKLTISLPAGMTLAQADNATFLLMAQGSWQTGQLVELSGQLLNALNDLHPLQPLPVRPSVSICTSQGKYAVS